MKLVRLILCLAVFVPSISILGHFTTLDSGKPLWFGLGLGAVIGVVFGLVFGGVQGKWLDFLLSGPEEEPDTDIEQRAKLRLILPSAKGLAVPVKCYKRQG